MRPAEIVGGGGGERVALHAVDVGEQLDIGGTAEKIRPFRVDLQVSVSVAGDGTRRDLGQGTGGRGGDGRVVHCDLRYPFQCGQRRDCSRGPSPGAELACGNVVEQLPGGCRRGRGGGGDGEDPAGCDHPRPQISDHPRSDGGDGGGDVNLGEDDRVRRCCGRRGGGCGGAGDQFHVSVRDAAAKVVDDDGDQVDAGRGRR